MTFRFGTKPFFSTPKRLRKTPALTLREIAQRIPKDTRLKSRKVGINRVWKGKTPRFLQGYTTYRAITTNTENGHQYRITVFSPTARVTLDSKVIIDSPVAIFMFRYEYALARRGNAFIYRSNGDPPVQTNPALIPGLDHHTYAFVNYLIKNTRLAGLREEAAARNTTRRLSTRTPRGGLPF